MPTSRGTDQYFLSPLLSKKPPIIVEETEPTEVGSAGPAESAAKAKLNSTVLDLGEENKSPHGYTVGNNFRGPTNCYNLHIEAVR